MMRSFYSLGLPMWSNREWLGTLFPRGTTSKNFLHHYSRVFNTVEGNTTFYALPSAETVAAWRSQAQPDFEFCFKLPRKVTHENCLKYSGVEVTEFLQRLEPLGEQLGPFMIQLPESFEPRMLADLEAFLQTLPQDFSYSVEVRHRDFFNRQGEERALNRMLRSYGVDRVCFDSRALFSRTAETGNEIDAQRKKPKLPVHALALGKRPLIRFIGSASAHHNAQFMLPWVVKIAEWQQQGLRPLMFIHTPDNRSAPQQAAGFHQRLNQIPGWRPLSVTIKDESQLTIF